MAKILVTGTAGFIGYHLVRQLCAKGHRVDGVDSLNSYYNVDLKLSRLESSGVNLSGDFHANDWVPSQLHSNYRFLKMDLADQIQTKELFENGRYDQVIHLAAQPGVRYSLENPHAYVESNILAFLNVLEGCRNFNIPKLIYASSSSVYGLNSKVPFSENDRVDNPVSLYAATKKGNELMAHTYSHLFGIQTIGLRFFTVYGPWGRPDMAPMIFAGKAVKGEAIQVFNHGNQSRDFTYVGDIVDGISRCSEMDFQNLYSVFNIGNGNPTRLLDFIDCLEKELGVEIKRELVKAQPGDVEKTYCDTENLNRATGYLPKTTISEGVQKFVEWYKSEYL